MENDKTELLGPKRKVKKITNCKRTIIVLSVLGLVGVCGFLGARKVRALYYFQQSPCFVPQYDNNGRLMNASVPCNLAMDNVFVSQYLHDDDIYRETLNGMKIFKPFKNHCFISTNLRLTKTKVDTYANAQSFYEKTSSDTNIDASIAGRFTMGATLNVKTDQMTAGEKDVMGSSIEILTHTRSIALDENCYKNPSLSSLTDDILKEFDDLPENIREPWLHISWERYDRFFEKFGTHLRTEVLLGSSLRQWTFAGFSESFTERALKVKACFDLLGKASSKIGVTLHACSDVTDEEFAKYSNILTSYNLEIRGGTDATRNALQGKQTQELIEKLLNEGRKMEFPITFKYKAIWDVFLVRGKGHGKRHKIAMNMKQYYMGYKDFGCTYIKIGGISARKFRYGNPGSFECVLAAQGCHDSDDCHGHIFSHIDNNAYCHGDTCLEYTDPAFGSKAKSVSARSKQKGDNDDKVNRGCIYESHFFQQELKCFNENEVCVIWDTDGKKDIAKCGANREMFQPFCLIFTLIFWILMMVEVF